MNKAIQLFAGMLDKITHGAVLLQRLEAEQDRDLIELNRKGNEELADEVMRLEHILSLFKEERD